MEGRTVLSKHTTARLWSEQIEVLDLALAGVITTLNELGISEARLQPPCGNAFSPWPAAALAMPACFATSFSRRLVWISNLRHFKLGGKIS
jgi:hypothetical protein